MSTQSFTHPPAFDPTQVPSSRNPQTIQQRQTAGASPLVSPAGENAAADPDSRMVITAPTDRASLVQVYEPAQSLDQTEVILDEFPIDGGETVKKEYRSATAAFRFLPLTEQARRELEKNRQRRDEPARLTEGQPGLILPETADEMSNGAARQAELEDADDAARDSERKRKVAGGTVKSHTADAELERGRADKEASTKGERKRRGRAQSGKQSSSR